MVDTIRFYQENANDCRERMTPENETAKSIKHHPIKLRNILGIQMVKQKQKR